MRGTMFVRNGAVAPGLSRECDITLKFFVEGRPKSAQQLRDSAVAARRVYLAQSSQVTGECRLSGLSQRHQNDDQNNF